MRVGEGRNQERTEKPQSSTPSGLIVGIPILPSRGFLSQTQVTLQVIFFSICKLVQEQDFLSLPEHQPEDCLYGHGGWYVTGECESEVITHVAPAAPVLHNHTSVRTLPAKCARISVFSYLVWAINQLSQNQCHRAPSWTQMLSPPAPLTLPSPTGIVSRLCNLVMLMSLPRAVE